MLLMRCIALVSLALVASACSFDRTDHAQACAIDAECPTDEHCYESFCVPREPSSTGCANRSQLESCYDGPSATMDVGSCQAGQHVCIEGTYSACLGQVLPDEEVCNGHDDDCNGLLDDVATSAACDSRLQGACSEGMLLCRDGIELCQPLHQSQTESCNAIDDDCDGMTDELASTACYPMDTAGCALDSQGAWQCDGLCATGETTCDGTAERCDGATTPNDEQCTTGTMLAQDEDCDGAIDEGCTCDNGDSRDCYAGPVGTRDHGICMAGTQSCSASKWGACAGQTMPSAETCENPDSDDDCNDVEDDVPGLGSACVAKGESGECRNGTVRCADKSEPECIAGAASPEQCDELDQDCDGDPTNGFDLNSDETCGACDVKCSPSQTCCGGSCLEQADLQNDPDNCGACGRTCGLGQYCCQGDCLSGPTGPGMAAACACSMACGDRSCCGSNCRDLDKDSQNCGACGRRCMNGQKCMNGMCK